MTCERRAGLAGEGEGGGQWGGSGAPGFDFIRVHERDVFLAVLISFAFEGGHGAGDGQSNSLPPLEKDRGKACSITNLGTLPIVIPR